MKSIFTKLGALLLIGVVTLVGCTDFSADLKEVNDRVANNEEAIKALKKEMADLKAEIVGKYATLNDIENVLATVASLQEALEAKADKQSVLEVADKLAEFEQLLADMDAAHVEDVESLNAALEAFKAELAAIKEAMKEAGKDGVDGVTPQLKIEDNYWFVSYDNGATWTKLGKATGNDGANGEDGKDGEDGNDGEDGKDGEDGNDGEDGKDGVNADTYDHSALENAIASLQTTIESLTGTMDTFKAEVTEALAAFDAQLAEISETVAAVPELANEVSAINETLVALQAALEAQNNAIAAKADAEDLASLEKEIAALTAEVDSMSEMFEDKVSALESKVLALIADAAYDDTALKNAISELQGQYAALAGKISNIEAAIEELKNSLRSIVAVPQVIDNGVKAIEFSTFTYAPLNDDNTVSENRVVKQGNSVNAYYLFNPSVFVLSNATYSTVAEDVKFITKAADAAVIVEGTPVYVNGKVQVSLKRGTGAGNMFALAAANKKNGEVVYSDYVKILDNEVKGEDFVLVNTNNQPVAVNAEEAEVITLNEEETFNFNEYVKVLNYNHADYGLAIVYSVLEGEVALAEGVATATKAGAGVSTVKVELVDTENGNVVKRAYINVEVKVKSVYYIAMAKASAEVSRTAFEVAAIPTWIQNLKDEPNTLERIKNAVLAVKEGKINDAIEYLNGVPGFVTKTKVIEGVGEGRAKVATSLDDAFESLLPNVDNINSLADLKEVLTLLAERYDESVYAELLKNYDVLGKLPIAALKETLNKIPVVGGTLSGALDNMLEGIENFDLMSLLVNDNVFNALSYIESLGNKYGINLFNLGAIKESLAEIIAKIEFDYTDTMIKTAEQAAEAAAKAQARALATENLVANFNAANAEIEANFANGTWGKARQLIDNEIAEKLFTKLELTDVRDALLDLFDYGLVLAQYDAADLLKAETEIVSVEKEEIFE